MFDYFEPMFLSVPTFIMSLSATLLSTFQCVCLSATRMYNIKVNEDFAINSKLLLNSDKESLEQLFIQHGVDPKSLLDMMTTVHEWYSKEPHLPNGRLDDQFLMRLLVMRKFSIEKVKQKIDNYFSMRPKMAEFLSNRDPMDPNLKTCLKTGYWIVLPWKTPENYRVTIFRMPSNTDITVLNLIKVVCMIVDYRMRNDSVMGEQVILDFSNVNLQLAMQMTPVLISKILYYTRKCLGAKLKGVHIVNMPPFTEFVLVLFKKLMKPKLIQRMHFYKSLDDVLKQFPENIIPKDLGGTDDVTCQEITDAWGKTLCSRAWRNYFIEQDSIHSDESRRIVRKNFDDDFGVDGSFKKLCID